jgi:hypothetical protein
MLHLTFHLCWSVIQAVGISLNMVCTTILIIILFVEIQFFIFTDYVHMITKCY